MGRLDALVAIVAILVIGALMYLCFFVGPDNNGERSIARNQDRITACTSPETATAAEIAVCIKALEASAG